MSKVKLKDILAAIDIAEISAAAAALSAAGHSREDVIDAVVEIVDAAIPWATLGPVGAAVEVVDGPVARALARLIVALALGKRGAKS